MGEVDLARFTPSRFVYDQVDPFYRIVLADFSERAASHPAVRVLRSAQVDADERMQRIICAGVEKGMNPMGVRLPR